MKLIICLLEGISDALLSEYVEHNLLPNFRKLFSEGNFGKLICTPIPYEASGIVTAFSGIDVHTHGIISYWKPINNFYKPEQWTSEDVRDYMFWNRKPFNSLRYCVMNIFGTQPVYNIDGYLISYSMDKNLRFTYPHNLLMDLNKRKLRYVQDTTVFYTKKSNRTSFYKDILKVDRLRKNVFFELLKEDIDVGIINFTQIDRISHFYFSQSNNVSREDSILFQAYKQSDEFLGELFELVEKNEAELLIFSEVGFGPLKKFVSINDYLNEKDLVRKIDEQVLYDNSLAFEAVQGTHGININRKGKYKYGLVSDKEYETVLTQVIEVIRQMPNPYTGRPMFKDIFPGREYSSGDNVPDILIEPYDWEYLPYGDPFWSNHVSRHSQTGWHRNTSFWGYYGKNIYNNGKKSLLDMFEIIMQTLQ